MQRVTIAGLAALCLLGPVAPAAADVSKAESHAECANGTVTATFVFHNLDGVPITGKVVLGPEYIQVPGNLTYTGTTGTLHVTFPDALADEGLHSVMGVFDWPGRTPSELRWASYTVKRCVPPIIPPPPAPGDPQLEPIPVGQARRAVKALLTHPKRWQFSTTLEDTRKVIFEGTKRRTGTVRHFTVTRRPDGLLHVAVTRRSPA